MWIKVILVLAMAVIAVLLLRTSAGARHQAIRRLMLLAFGVVTVGSVLFPDVWNAMARLVGVGRGSDLLLYGLIVAFLGYLLTSYVRFRAMESQLTLLARRLALDEAPRRFASLDPITGPIPMTAAPVTPKPEPQVDATGADSRVPHHG